MFYHLLAALNTWIRLIVYCVSLELFRVMFGPKICTLTLLHYKNTVSINLVVMVSEARTPVTLSQYQSRIILTKILFANVCIVFLCAKNCFTYKKKKTLENWKIIAEKKNTRKKAKKRAELNKIIDLISNNKKKTAKKIANWKKKKHYF